MVKNRIKLIKCDVNHINSALYWFGPRDRKYEWAKSDKMLGTKDIEPTQSKGASIIISVPKNGSPRFCVELIKLNAVTVKDAYRLPRMDECLQSLGELLIWFKLKGTSGYWQLRLTTGQKQIDVQETLWTVHNSKNAFRSEKSVEHYSAHDRHCAVNG